MDINLSEFPKCREKIREVVKQQLVAIQAEMLKQIPAGMEYQVPEIIPQQIDLTIEYLLKNNFRFLYDVFDNEHVMLLLDGPDEMHGWTWQVRSDKQVENDKEANSMTRIDVEKVGFEKCFKILEEKL